MHIKYLFQYQVILKSQFEILFLHRSYCQTMSQSYARKQFLKRFHDYNSAQSQKYGHIYQLAYISSQIIFFLEKWTLNLHQPLRLTIIRKINTYQEIQQQIRNKLLSLFEGGVQINGDQYNQERMQLGKNQNGKTTFFPTYITKRIFELLKDSSFKKVSAHYGISKTTSCILYKYLNNMIFQYVVEKKTKQSNIVMDSWFKKCCQNMMFTFYYSVNMQHNLDQVLELLYIQLPLKHRQILLQMQVTTFDIAKIRRFYNSMGIKTHLIIDGINIIASNIRKTGYKKQFYDFPNENRHKWQALPQIDHQTFLYNQMKPHQQIQAQHKQKVQTIKKIFNFQRILNAILPCFYGKTMLSSNNLQQDKLAQIHFYGQSNMDLIFNHKIENSQIFSNKSYKMQMLDFLTYKLQEKKNIQFFRIQQQQSKNQQNEISKNQDSCLKYSFAAQEKIQQQQNRQLRGKKQQQRIFEKSGQQKRPKFRRKFYIQPEPKKIVIKNNLKVQEEVRKFFLQRALEIFTQGIEPFILTPLQISSFIKVYSQKKYEITQINQVQRIDNFLKEIKYQISQSSKKRLLKSLEIFRKKDTILQFPRTLFLYCLIQQMQEYKSTRSNRHQYFSIEYEKIKDKLLTMTNIQVLIDSNMFQISTKRIISPQFIGKKKTVSILFPPLLLNKEDFLSLEKSYLNIVIQYDSNVLLSNIRTKSGRGQMIQTLLIHAIDSSHSLFILYRKQTQHILKEQKSQKIVPLQQSFHQIQKYQEQNLQKAYKRENQIIQSYIKEKFNQKDFKTIQQGNLLFQFESLKKYNENKYFKTLPLNVKNKKKISFFKQLLCSIKLIPNKSYLLLPMKKQTQESKQSCENWSQNSKSIDFVLVTIIQSEITIILADVSTNRQLNPKKIKNFLKEYINFQDRNQKKIKISDNQFTIKANYMLINTLSQKNVQSYLSELNQIADNRFIIQTEKKNEILKISGDNQTLERIIFKQFHSFQFFVEKGIQIQRKPYLLFKSLSRRMEHQQSEKYSNKQRLKSQNKMRKKSKQ